MRASHSQTILRSKPDRSRSFRCLYSNQEFSNTKDIATIFHSPFKHGLKNKNYTNPTFVSSTIFYPEDYNQHHQTEATIPKNVIFNQNQKIKKQLYEKRMNIAESETNICHNPTKTLKQEQRQKLKLEKSRKNLRQSSNRTNKNNQLIHQLQNLIKFDESRYKNKQKTKQLSRRRQTEQQTPIFLQKNRLEMDYKIQYENRQNLQQWMRISSQINNLKKQQNKKSQRKQAQGLTSYVKHNVLRNKNQYQEEKKNATILASILREQIQHCQQKQNKYKYF